ncbi:MAG: ABC transporter ATP-binding protein [Bacteroidota bacterium]
MLQLADVNLIYDGGQPAARRVLTDIRLGLGRSGRIALGGVSGAGKSSLLVVMAGLLPPSAGSVIREPGLTTGLVLQEPELALFARTVADELAFAPQQAGLTPDRVKAAITNALADVGLPTSILACDPIHLPSDTKRLVALAAVLTARPGLLLLDEPTVGLGAAARARVIGLIERFQGAVVVASHDLDLLWRTSTRLVLLRGGRIAYDGAWAPLVSDPAPLHDAGLELPGPLQVLAGLRSRGWAPADPGRSEEDVAAAILAGWPENAWGGNGD